MRHLLVSPYIVKTSGQVVFSANMPFALNNLSSNALAFLRRLQAGLDSAEVAVATQDRELDQLFQILESKEAIRTHESIRVRPEDQKTFDFLCSVSPDPIAAWHKVQSAHLIILGCGGIGAECAESLTGMGFTKFTCIDGDKVAAHNLNRQTIFAATDVGASKVVALKSRLLEKRPYLEIETIERFVTGPDSLSDCLPSDAACLIAGIDQPPILSKLWTLDACIQKTVPCIFTGVGIRNGSIGPCFDDVSQMASYREKIANDAAQIDTSRTAALGPSLGASNLTICAILCHDVFRLVSGIETPLSLNKQLLLRFDTLALKAI